MLKGVNKLNQYSKQYLYQKTIINCFSGIGIVKSADLFLLIFVNFYLFYNSLMKNLIIY